MASTDRYKEVREIAKVLHNRYGTPDLGNLEDPLDELVFILTTFKTNHTNYMPVFHALKREFETWDQLLSTSLHRLKRLMRPAGLSNQKAPRLVQMLKKVKKDHGALSLDWLAEMEDDVVEGYLRSFKGVGKKGARCVMLYSLGREVLPVDTHTVRVFKRLGYLDQAVSQKRAQDIIQCMVPPDVRKRLHVNIVVHGRQTCLPKQPLCQHCCINLNCSYFNRPNIEPIKCQ